SKRPAAVAVRACFRTPCADLGTRDQPMAITPTTATTENTPERMSSGFQRTVIGLYSFGSSCRAARHGRRCAEGPSGPSGGPSIRGVENRQEILGNDRGNHVQKVRERPGPGSSAQASERRCEWEGATPFALIPRRGRIPLPLNPRIRAPHTIRYSPPGHQAQYSRRTKETFLIVATRCPVC